MLDPPRYRMAAKAAGIHGLATLLAGSFAAWLVFSIWYTFPYRELSGGRDLFLLLMVSAVVCGPLLTFVLFNPKKPRKELLIDLSLVALIQIAALGYGVWTVWQSRPLYLVHEVDRYKVISALDVKTAELEALPEVLKPQFWAGPQVVSIRSPKNAEEHNKVLFEAAAGGRDYGARPEFYVPYDGAAALKTLSWAKPLALFLQKQPSQQDAARKLAADKGADMAQWLYVPVIARQDWVAVIDKQGQIQGFLRGDGF